MRDKKQKVINLQVLFYKKYIYKDKNKKHAKLQRRFAYVRLEFTKVLLLCKINTLQ